MTQQLVKLTNISQLLKDALNNIIVGQEAVVDQLLIALLAEGHVLMEGVPGTAKTLLAKTLARLISVDFARVQLTPDMLPSDIIGTSVYDLNSRSFHVKKGPIFTGLLLADEINRTPPKTQSALLEAMEEHQVTLDGQTHILPEPFMVIATQNPIEFEGTYPLPEAQLDRFMLKIIVSYPGKLAETSILRKWQSGDYSRHAPDLTPLVTREDILECRGQLKFVQVEESIFAYISELIEKTRNVSDLYLGASPRAAINWLAAAKAQAAIAGKDFVTPDEIKMTAHPILRHRLILTPEAEMEGITINQVIDNLMNQVKVPR
ncbi:MAG: MoxR family ATPase [Candidatus Obscuribacterales bacterium]|nr:MoxR family ATPase [Candidatus Obscuribacterales bacterium]